MPNTTVPQPRSTLPLSMSRATMPPTITVTGQPQRNQHGLLLFNLRFAAKIMLTVGAVSCLGIILVLIFITGTPGESYGAASRYYSLGHRYIGPILLATWLFLMSFSGVFTWLISLYSSFGIAGQLYRFARNLEAFIQHGPVTPIPTRETDQLKQEEQQIQRSIIKLQQHYGAMRNAAEAALPQSGSQLAALITKLKELDHEAHL